MNAPDPQALQAADDAAVDQVMRSHFHIEPVEDPSGLLGQPGLPAGASEDEMQAAYMRRHFGVAVVPASPTQAPAPAQQAAQAMPEIAQGPRSPAPRDDGAMVDEYVRRYWPQTRREGGSS